MARPSRVDMIAAENPDELHHLTIRPCDDAQLRGA
jgi:hypothetical protein